MRSWNPPLVALLAALAVACGEPPALAPAQTPATSPPEPQADEEAGRSALENLAQIGYAEFGEEKEGRGDKNERGLVLRDPERSAPGYTLLTALPESRALLIDAQGNVVRSWENPESIEWERAELGPDGDLLVVGLRNLSYSRAEKKLARENPDEPRLLNSRGRYLARYRFSGELLWIHSLPVHHDAQLEPDGNILALGDAPRREGDFDFRDNLLLQLSGEGEVLKQVSLFDVLSARPELYQLKRVAPHGAVLPDKTVDLFHANSCRRMPFPALAAEGELYRANNVLVSIRHQDLIAIIDLEAERLLWCWGPGEVLGQHEASWLENGDILLFDNGNERGYSRIVEMDPRTNAVVWTYTAPEPEDFYCQGRGTVQALANGNVLVADTNSGEVFEATRAGEVVWRYVQRNDEGRLIPLRARRYDAKRIEALLAGE